MTIGEMIWAGCWYALLLGSIAWLAVGLTKYWKQRRQHPLLRLLRR
ncbi:hypothetical protein [Cryptosporangium phraense]|nr:hypothetical protein [Cryptosporangium phraense]